MANPANRPSTNFPTTVTSACNILLGDAAQFAVIASCTGTPPTTADTFQHGCVMIATDGSTGVVSLFVNTGSTTTPVWNPLSSPALPSASYVKDNSNGANNAITVSLWASAVGVKAVLTTGSRVSIELTHTLQKGANTLNINGTTKSIVNSTNLANLTTGYAVGGVIEVMYLPGVGSGIYVDLKQ